jgi:Tol biopolymer transport system component
VLALIGLLIIGSASVWGLSLLGIESAEPESEQTAVVAAASSGPASATTASTLTGAGSLGDIDITGGQVDGEGATPALGEELVRPPEGRRPNVKGTIVFARDRDIWAASGQSIDQLTNSRADSSPTWSHDGKHIFFVRTTVKDTTKARKTGKYTFYMGDIMRMDANGSDRKRIYKSLIEQPTGLWFSHVLQPDISPDGKTLALVSDGPDGEGDVVLHTLAAKANTRLRKTRPNSVRDLGHNDPEWSPDGKSIAFTQNQASGTTGKPRIGIYRCKSKKNCEQGKVKYLKFNYANPSWSPDGNWLAVEKTTGTGRDIVIVSADKGDQLAGLTKDGDSFAPVVSPDGDQIAYLHRDGVDIDIRVMTLDVTGGDISLLDDSAITNDGGIDAGSTPAWYIPEDQLTPPIDAVEDGAPDLTAGADEQTLGSVTP